MLVVSVACDTTESVGRKVGNDGHPATKNYFLSVYNFYNNFYVLLDWVARCR